MKDMMRQPARNTAIQVGEFLVGVTAAYVAVGATWATTGSMWASICIAIALCGIAAFAELRFGARVTGLVAGLLPGAVLTAGLLAALSIVLTRLST